MYIEMVKMKCNNTIQTTSKYCEVWAFWVNYNKRRCYVMLCYLSQRLV